MGRGVDWDQMADVQEPPNPDRSPGSAAHAQRPVGGRQHLSAINHIQVGDATSASRSPGKIGNNQCRTPKTIATGRPVMSISACQKQLRAAEIFHKQTEARIENMKKAVLQANTSVKLLGEGVEQSKAKESVAQMVNLIQGLVRRASNFKLDQDDAVVAMQALLSFNNENGCNSPVEKKRIISHFQNIEKTKHAQLEGEKRLDALLAAIPKPAHPPRPTNVHSDGSATPAPPLQSTSRPPAPLPASLASKQAAPTSSSLPSPRSPRRDNMAKDIDPAEPSSSPPDSSQKLGHAVCASRTQEQHKDGCWIEDNDEPLASPPKLPPRQVQKAAPNPPSLVFLPSVPAPDSTAHKPCDAQELHRVHETARGDISQAAIDAHDGMERRGNQDETAKQPGIGTMYGVGVGADAQGKMGNAVSGDGIDHTVTATMHGGQREMGSRRQALSLDGEVAENVRSGAGDCSESSSRIEGRRSKADGEDAAAGRLRVLEDMTSPQGFHFRAGEVCTMVREGSMGWTLVRDASGKLSWLPSDKVELAGSNEGPRDGGGSRAMQNALEAVMLNAALSDAGGGAEIAPRASDAVAAASPGFQQSGMSKSKSKGGAGVVGMALGRDTRGNIVVVALREDGPAHSNEMISPGDVLLAIDSYTVHASDDLEQVSCMLSGPPSSVVSLFVEKPDGNRLVANLTRRTPALFSLASPSHHSASLSGNGISAPLSGGRRSACPPISPVLSSRSPSSPNPASPSVLIFSPQEGDALFSHSKLVQGRGGATQSSAVGREGAEDVSSMSRLFSLSPSTSPCLSADLEASNEHRTSRCTSSSTDNMAGNRADDDEEDRIALSKMLSAISSQNRVARMLEAAANDLSTINSPSSSNPKTHDPSSYPLNIVCDAMHPTLPPQAAKRPFMVSPSPIKRHDYRSGDISPLGTAYSPLSLV